MRMSDWSSDVCSSDLAHRPGLALAALLGTLAPVAGRRAAITGALFLAGLLLFCGSLYLKALGLAEITDPLAPAGGFLLMRSEEHTSELQSLMRISYAVFCLKKNKTLLETTITSYSK